MNIEDKAALHPCTSCQMCAAVCPTDAIAIRLDKEGFYRPYVDSGLCVDCGQCVKVCYKYDSGIRMTTADGLEAMPLYAAAARDAALLQQVTSGGIADLLAKRLVAEGYSCIGVGYDDSEARAYDYCARDNAATDGFRGSKYIQSYTYPAFRELVRQSRKEKFAVFGTPCQIYAIDRFLTQRKLRDRCLLVDLFCHGCPSLHAWQKYQREVKRQVRKPRFDRVDFRSKVKGWGNFYVVVAVVEGIRAFTSSPGKDGFYELFFSDQVLNAACSDCRLRSTMAYTDIRLGDFWGKKYALNTSGVSAVALTGDRGRRLFEAIGPSLWSERASYGDMLPYQSYGRNYQPDEVLRTVLLRQLSDPSLPLSVTVRTFRKSQGLRGRLKRHAKHLLYYLPASVTIALKRWI